VASERARLVAEWCSAVLLASVGIGVGLAILARLVEGWLL
jgi:hypothetical protein